jgi:hypothetical protein
MAITSPLTIADKTAILKVLNTKSTKANKATIGAIKKYLGNYPDPALGLQDAIDDVVAGSKMFTRTSDMTPGEADLKGNDGDKGTIPGYGKNAAQAVLDWASKNMSEATKRWIAGKVVESKNAMQAIEAFESTDIVAKRRELEKAFEGGFDVTSDADNKRLADILEKLGIDESDPMVRGLMAQGSLFNMAVPPSRRRCRRLLLRCSVRVTLQGRSAPLLHPALILKSQPWLRSWLKLSAIPRLKLLNPCRVARSVGLVPAQTPLNFSTGPASILTCFCTR